MSKCCPDKAPEPKVKTSCCPSAQSAAKRRPDYLLWVSGTVVVAGYMLHLAMGGLVDDHATWPQWLTAMTGGIFELVNKMWWGLLAAVVFVGLLERIPRELVMSALGSGGTLKGIGRATLAGVLLDLCSHGILMVGAKLYERGASIGQLMAFLIASPWNSLSLTIVMIALIGWQWTLLFIGLSMLVGIITGIVFDRLAANGALPANPHQIAATGAQPFWPGLMAMLKKVQFTPGAIGSVLKDGIRDSRMVFRWLLFGIVIAVLIRALVPMDVYQALFGPTVAGLLLTLVAATIIEVCSEGSTPVAADLLTRAAAPGNGFTFLMAGVATDYTEIMVLKDVTRSWKIALFLPLITLPQVLIIGWVLNQAASGG